MEGKRKLLEKLVRIVLMLGLVSWLASLALSELGTSQPRLVFFIVVVVVYFNI